LKRTLIWLPRAAQLHPAGAERWAGGVV